MTINKQINDEIPSHWNRLERTKRTWWNFQKLPGQPPWDHSCCNRRCHPFLAKVLGLSKFKPLEAPEPQMRRHVGEHKWRWACILKLNER